MHGCITLKRPRIVGARLHIHWSALVAAGILFGMSLRQPVHAVVVVICYFGLILLHEAGHALVAKRLGYAPIDVYLTFIHGLCVYEHPDTIKEDAMVAWGGVLAQVVVAVPVIALAHTTSLGSLPLFPIIVSIFGYLSVAVAVINIAPAKGLDGAIAWRLVPILWHEFRQRSSAAKAAKRVIRRIK
jgi:Zn-dependent protease